VCASRAIVIYLNVEVSLYQFTPLGIYDLYIYVKTEHFTLCAKDNNASKTARIKVFKQWKDSYIRIISQLKRNCWGFGAKWPSKCQNSENNLLEGHFFAPNCVFWAWNYLACRPENKQELRQGTTKWRIQVERPLAGGFQPIFALVLRLAEEIKHAKFHGYMKSCDMYNCPCCHRVARPSLTLCYALPRLSRVISFSWITCLL